MPAPVPTSHAPRIAISMGDPLGVGPEVIVKALADASLRSQARWIIVGSTEPMLDAAKACRITPFWSIAHATQAETALQAAGAVVLLDDALHAVRDCSTRRPTAEAGAASLHFVRSAIALAKNAVLPPPWRADAIVTAPISKEAWALAGETRYPGHTELFAEEFASPWSAMMFAAEPAAHARGHAIAAGLHVILATTHVPLAQVASLLTTARVLEVIELGAATMRRLGIASPRVGVCGLNPHAGEAGLLGSEDAAIIAPAIAQARSLGIDATGPYPADTIFARALAWPGHAPARFDLVVAMYHDQGLIPLKLVAFDRAVNFTVGLGGAARPIVRTSPDHGTAYDIAGTGTADAGSMHAAMRLAIRLASRES